MGNGRTIRLYLVDGVPTGVIAAEIMNWTGHVLSAPRTRLADLVKREEARRTGIYFLVGASAEEDTRPSVYIGESDNVAGRLAQHNRPEESGGKDFWDRVLVVTSKDRNLTKGHVKYLESKLIGAAKSAGRVSLINAHDIEYLDLPEADRDDMDYFADQVRIVMPMLGQEFLRPRPVIPKPASEDPAGEVKNKNIDDVVFVIVSDKHELYASAIELDGEFIVLAGSEARAEWVGDRKHNTHYWRLHDELVAEQKLVSRGDHLVFSEDIAFSSPSAAAAIVYGRSANGRTSWKVKESGETYAAYSDRTVEEAAGNSLDDS